MFRIACREALHLRDIVRGHALARCPTTFWQLIVFRPPFCILSNFSSFLPILRYFFGLVSIFHNVLVTIYELPVKKEPDPTPPPLPPPHCGRSWAQMHAAGLPGQQFFKRKSKMADEDLHSTDSSISVKIIQQFYWLILEFLQD